VTVLELGLVGAEERAVLNGKSQNARRVGSRRIATELTRHRVQETFCLFEIHAFDLPDDLMVLWRTIQDVVRLRDDPGILDRFEGFWAAVIQVNVDSMSSLVRVEASLLRGFMPI
jgi:hypothetical protein